MSSDEEDNDPETGLTSAQKSKRRRIQRACDMCRRKKSTCDCDSERQCSSNFTTQFDVRGTIIACLVPPETTI